jgi:hypothetical protein
MMRLCKMRYCIIIAKWSVVNTPGLRGRYYRGEENKNITPLPGYEKNGNSCFFYIFLYFTTLVRECVFVQLLFAPAS